MTANDSTALVNATLIAVTNLPGAMFWRANCGLLFARSGQRVKPNIDGTPDIIGAYKGRPVGIECKFGKGVLSKDQKNFRDGWVKAEGIYIVGRSVEQVLAELGAI